MFYQLRRGLKGRLTVNLSDMSLLSIAALVVMRVPHMIFLGTTKGGLTNPLLCHGHFLKAELI